MAQANTPPVVAQVNGSGSPQKVKPATANDNRKLPQTTANKIEKRPFSNFAVAEDLFSDEDFDTEFDPFREVDAKVWRIERRYRMRQDGHKIMYWNYRRRSIKKVKGKQRVEYMKGGSIVVS